MIELDRLIQYYRDLEHGYEKQPFTDPKDALMSTITYLVAFKQTHEMLQRLAEAIQGANPEGD